MNEKKTLLDEMREYQPEKGRFAFWWLGQMGFGIKLAGMLLFVDAFLSPHERRTVPPAINVKASESADLVLGSHDHTDHIDRKAWVQIAQASPKTRFVVPEFHRESVMGELGVPASRVLGVEEDKPLAVAGLTIRAIPSAHEFLDTDPETGRHPFLGFVLEADGVRIYHAGDTCIYEGLYDKLRAHAPFDVMFVPINGRDGVRFRRNTIGNMTAQEAVDLVGAFRPRLAVPGHYEMFTANPGDPQLFADYLDAKYPGIPWWYGEHFTRVDL